MKNQLTLLISLLASGFLLLAQASETKTKSETPESSGSEVTPDSMNISESQQTPDSINDYVDGEGSAKITADQLPRIYSTMSPQEKELFQGAHKGDITTVKVQVEKGAQVNYVDKEKRTALMLAANNGHTAVVEYLLSKGADINLADKSGMTALMYTAKRSFTETAALLLQNGAEVNVKSKKKGVTALMLASVWGNKVLVQMLLEKGADPAIRAYTGRTAEMYAKQRNHPEIVKILSEAQVPQSD